MFWKLVHEPFRRPRRRRALWAIAAIALGTAVAAAMLSVSLDVGDRVGNELRSLGANIVISPAADTLPVEVGGVDYRPVSEGAYISAASLPKLKEIFWRNNILAFAPYLHVPGRAESASGSVEASIVGTWFSHSVGSGTAEPFRTGILALNPTWKLEGRAPEESAPTADTRTAEALVGRALAEKLSAHQGRILELSLASESHSDPDGAARLALRVTGVLTTGGAEDDQIFVPLAAAQQWAGLPDMARTVAVSALIKPEDDLSRKGPARMTPTEYDRWYCSPYLSSILHQIGEALPETSARAVRQVAETQGSVLGKLNFLMGLLAVVALAMATLSISSLAGLSVLERRHEIGLMKALGAQDGLVAGFFLAETAFQGLAGGLLGFAASELLARALAQAVFGVTIETHWMVLPATLLVALTVSLTGAWLPIRRAVAANPSQVLRGA